MFNWSCKHVKSESGLKVMTHKCDHEVLKWITGLKKEPFCFLMSLKLNVSLEFIDSFTD